MKKTVLLIMAVMLLVPVLAWAELSTNLRVETVMNQRNRRIVDHKTFVDSQGNPVIPSDKGYATIRYSYTTGNRVEREEFLDTKGNLINSVDGYAVKTIRYSAGKVTQTAYFDQDGKPAMGPDGYAREESKYRGRKHQSTWQYDADGNITGTHRITEYYPNNLVKSDTWYDAEKNLKEGPNGYARVEYAYSGNKKTRVAYTAPDGSSFYNAKEKYATMTAEYKNGMIRNTYYYGAENELVPGPKGYAYALYTYTDKNSLEMFYNADGTPYINSDGICGTNIRKVTSRMDMHTYFVGDGVRGQNKDGIGATKITYNLRRNIISQEYFDENDQPIIVEKLGYHRVKHIYRKAGLETDTEYYGPDGKPMLNKDGYWAVRRTFKLRKLIQEDYYGLDGKKANGNAGYAQIQYQNENNKVAAARYFTADGQPFSGPGYDEVRYTWDGQQKASETYWKDGQTVNCTDGYHEIRYEYNGSGKETKRTYLDTEGQKVLCPDGYAINETEYNSNGGVMSRKYYDADGQLINTPGKEYAFTRTVLFRDVEALAEADEDEAEETDEGTDELLPETADAEEEDEEGDTGDGSILEYHGTDGRLMNIEAGYAYIVRENNEQGQVISESYFDADGVPTVLAAGYSVIKREYNSDALQISESYYSADGARAANTNGYDEVRREYNERKQISCLSYYLDGASATITAGYAALTREYDEAGNISAENCFGPDGEPVLCTSGYHRVERTWVNGRAVSEAWFDTDGQPMVMGGNTYVKRERDYDEAGNAAVERYYGPDGEKIATADGYDELRRTYNENRQVVRQEHYLNGELTMLPKGYAILTREYDEDGNMTAENCYNGQEEPVICAAGYYRVERTWAERGKAASEAWFGTDGAPIAPKNTYVKVEREYDGDGNPAVERYYGADGEKIACTDGYDEIRRTYNEKKLITRMEYFLGGEPVMLSRGYAVLSREYNEDNQVISESCYGTAGEPVICAAGYFQVKRTWADKDHADSEAWFGLDGEPIAPRNTYVKVERAFDEAGNIAAERYYGPDGEKIASTDGYDEVRREYNDKKQAVRLAYYLQDAPVMLSRGYAALAREYDESGNIISESCYDEKNEPVICKAGYYRVERTWMSSRIISEAWFDTDGQPMAMNGNTYVKIEKDYDDAGNVTVERYYGPDGEKIACAAGYDEIRRVFNEQKKAVRTEHYMNGELFSIPKGYAIILREYDEAGLTASERYLNEKEEPAACTAGYHRIDRTWADPNHAASEAWFDTEGQPMVINNNTYVRVEREYDEAWNNVDERYYDADGELIPCKAEYDELKRVYNDQKQATWFGYYVKGELFTLSKGYAAMKRAYDENGFTASESYFGPDGEPVLCSSGYHRIDREWIDNNHAKSEAWFDTQDQPMTLNNTYCRREREYDEAWNIITERYCDENGQKIPCTEGYDEIRREYDEKKQPIKISYFLQDEPFAMPRGFTSLTRAYDENGFTASESYFGAAGEPVMSTNGYHRIDRTWADKNHAKSEAWFDTEGKPVTLNGNTYVSKEMEYDEAWNITVEKYFDADGNAIACKDGYDEFRRVFDEKKQVVKIEYFLNGEPFVMPRGFTSLTRVYDEDGFIASESYFGADGEPVLSTNGYHRIDRTWADKNHAKTEAWFDTEGKPIALNGNAYVSREMEYDEEWNTITERYYDEAGGKAPAKDGYDEIRRVFNDKKQATWIGYYLNDEPFTLARGFTAMKRTYDEDGRVAKESYFGPEGEPVMCSNGYHRIDRTWIDNSHTKTEAWFDTQNQPMTMGNTFCKREREYDEAWNVITEWYYNEKNELIPSKDGYDEFRREYNDKKQAVRYSYFLKGEPVTLAGGFAVMRRAYDEAGLVAEESYYDADEKPVANTAGYHKVVRVWKNKDEKESEKFFDTEGKEIVEEEKKEE